MATPSSNQNPSDRSTFGTAVTERLGKINFILWQTQVLPAVKGARLMGYLDGSTEAPDEEISVKKGEEVITETNPAYEDWEAQDQKVLSFLVSSLSREVLPYAAGVKTAAELWEIIQGMYAAKSHAHTTNTSIALASAEKVNKSMGEYVTMMKSLENEMISAGKTLEDEDMVSYILAGLKDDCYTGLVAAILAMTEPITVSELYSQLLSYESRQQMLRGVSQSSANAAMRGGRGRFGGRGGGGRGYQGSGNPQDGGNSGQNGYNGGNNGRGRGNYNNNGRGRGNGSGGNGRGDRPRCQVCYIQGHVASDCCYRFDPDFVPRERTAANVNNGGHYNNNGGWVMDTGATDHITSELERLHAHERYHGNDQIHAANGAGMNITHIGETIIPTHDQNLHLKDVLLVPEASKSLISAHRFTNDNHAFVEIHPEFFCVKDKVTRTVLLDGPCKDGLYPLPESSTSSSTSKQAYGVFKPSHHRWHSRLGHPASSIVQRFISENKLPCSRENNEMVCEACLKAKSHQLPYSRSTSVSHHPLDLIFSDVWGPAPTLLVARIIMLASLMISANLHGSI
jgi:hypothetical protein